MPSLSNQLLPILQKQKIGAKIENALIDIPRGHWTCMIGLREVMVLFQMRQPPCFRSMPSASLLRKMFVDMQLPMKKFQSQQPNLWLVL